MGTGIRPALGGAGFALLGILLVEGLIAVGLRPLSPLGWPGGGMLVGAAMFGPAGALGGTLVAGAYFLLHFAHQARFPIFFATPVVIFGWIATLAVLAVFLMGLRQRLQRELVSVRELRETQEELRAANQRLELALEGSGTVLWDTDLVTRKVALNAAWSELLGGPAVETRTTVEDLMKLIHPDDLQAAVAASMDTVRGRRQAYSHEHRVRANDGRWIWILSRGRVAERDPKSGRAKRMIGTNIDITARRLAEERMQDLAQHDGLTGTANRALLLERIKRALVRSKRSDRRPALLYLDVDHFKSVNDRLGHAAGDEILKEFAARLERCVREADTVARVGGDEFVVLLEDVADGDGARRVAEKIAAVVQQPSRAEGQVLAVTASIGVALHDRAENADQWMRRADAALYEAKAAGRDTVRFADQVRTLQ
ncbi:MAG TPA: diguanylate cyclase [Burkholderiales bacterium]|nr:diguanylate cyclase [Burkholderiales bacterium]